MTRPSVTDLYVWDVTGLYDPAVLTAPGKGACSGTASTCRLEQTRHIPRLLRTQPKRLRRSPSLTMRTGKGYVGGRSTVTNAHGRKGDRVGTGRRARGTLLRRLALAKVRELRRTGMTYREIGRRFGGAALGQRLDAVAPLHLLELRGADVETRHEPGGEDHQELLNALKELEQPVAIHSCGGSRQCVNRAMRRAVEEGVTGAFLRSALQSLASLFCRLAEATATSGGSPDGRAFGDVELKGARSASGAAGWSRTRWDGEDCSS